MTLTTMKKLAKALGVEVGDLFYSSVAREPIVEYTTREYPVAARLRLGRGTLQWEYDRTEPGPPGIQHEKGLWFEVQGESMEPRWFDGDLVFVHPDVKPLHGEFAVVAWDDYLEGAVKQVFYNSGKIVLKSLNPKVDPILISDPEHQISFMAVITDTRHHRKNRKP